MAGKIAEAVRLRPFDGSAADYAALAAIANAAFPDNAETAAEMQHWDAICPAHCALARWLAEVDGIVVAAAEYFHASWMYHPRKFFASIAVLPSGRDAGLAAGATRN